jgi:hypothetical protein
MTIHSNLFLGEWGTIFSPHLLEYYLINSHMAILGSARA